MFRMVVDFQGNGKLLKKVVGLFFLLSGGGGFGCCFFFRRGEFGLHPREVIVL